MAIGVWPIGTTIKWISISVGLVNYSLLPSNTWPDFWLNILRTLYTYGLVDCHSKLLLCIRISRNYTCSEHQAIVQNLKDETVLDNPKMKVCLEMQLKQLEDCLKSKSEQIHIVKKQINACSGVHSPVPKLISQDSHFKDQKVFHPHRSDTQLCFLKKMKELQSTLQSEDLSWK